MNLNFARICDHAGLSHGSAEGLCIVNSLSDPASLAACLDDLIDSFQIINIELNGKVPSAGDYHAEYLPRSLAYAVGEILRCVRIDALKDANQSHRTQIEQAAFRIETAWLAILAGDIDDIVEHILQEETAM